MVENNIRWLFTKIEVDLHCEVGADWAVASEPLSWKVFYIPKDKEWEMRVFRGFNKSEKLAASVRFKDIAELRTKRMATIILGQLLLTAA